MHFPFRAACSVSNDLPGWKSGGPEAKIAVVSGLIPSKRHLASEQPAIPVLMRNSLFFRGFYEPGFPSRTRADH